MNPSLDAIFSRRTGACHIALRCRRCDTIVRYKKFAEATPFHALTHWVAHQKKSAIIWHFCEQNNFATSR